MSIYFSKFALNTFRGTPYFQAQLPSGYLESPVLQKCRAFRRLPPNLRELSALSKRWAERHNLRGTVADDAAEIGQWYDSDGYELDPDTGRRLTDAEIDAQWTPDPSLDAFTVTDIPIPAGGFPDPDSWEEPRGTVAAPVQEREREREDEDWPDGPQLESDVASRGREATAKEYGVTLEELDEMMAGYPEDATTNAGNPNHDAKGRTAPLKRPDPRNGTVR